MKGGLKSLGVVFIQDRPFNIIASQGCSNVTAHPEPKKGVVFESVCLRCKQTFKVWRLNVDALRDKPRFICRRVACDPKNKPKSLTRNKRKALAKLEATIAKLPARLRHPKP